MTLLKMIADQDRNLLFVGSVQLTQDNRDDDVYERSTARIALPCHGCLCSATKVFKEASRAAMWHWNDKINVAR